MKSLTIQAPTDPKKTSDQKIDINALPTSSGIYFFYSQEHHPIYIGKSINIRQRVLSHIYEAKTNPKERKILNATQYVKHTETPSELTALLLESIKIKEYSPIFNRQLRKLRKTYSWCIITHDEYFKPRLVEANWPPRVENNSFGLYRSKTHAEKHIRMLSDKHQLCNKVLGLEKTPRSCFKYQLKKCLGACIKLEPAKDHNQRFIDAVKEHQVKAWPYKGPIGIIESKTPDTVHIIDNWQLVATKNGKNQTHEFKNSSLDRDTYKIIAGYVFNPNKNVEIIEFT